MDSNRYHEAKEIFLGICDLHSEQRLSALETRCGDDVELRKLVEGMLENDRDPLALDDGERVIGAIQEAFGDPSLEAFNPESMPDTRYPIKETIGRGGMGIVLRAQDDKLQRDVAMKLLLADSKTKETPFGATRARRFVEEAQITGQLDHPGVVPVHELQEDDKGQTYFTMRLVEGITLGEVFEKVKAGDEEWNQTRALSALLKVCETMAFAHSRGIIHRDLKPANIMVGKFGEVYVMDWGIAKVMGAESSRDIRIDTNIHSETAPCPEGAAPETDDHSPLFTKDGDVVGTPVYMAPEQARGEINRVAQPADVYSMGALLYQLLSGQCPYDSCRVSSPRMVLDQVTQRPPDPLLELAPKAMPELVAICEKAMSRKIEDRYADMIHMSDDLRAYLENRVVKAHRTGALIELQKWIQRNKGMAAGLLSTLIAIGIGAAGYLYITVKKNAEIEKSRAELQVQKDAAERSLSLLEVMLSSGDPDNLGGPEYTVRQMLDDFEQRQTLDDVSDSPEVTARIRGILGRTYRKLGELEKSERHLTEALRLRRQLYGKDDRRTLDVLYDWTRLRKDQGKLDEAERAARELLAKRRKLLGDEHQAVAASLDIFASVLRLQGKFEEAEEIQRQALERMRRLFGDGHQNVAALHDTLATILRLRGKLDEAEINHRQAIDISRRLLGDEHPAVANYLNNLSAVLHELGELDEAEVVLRHALNMRRRLFGDEHPLVAGSLANLASVLSTQGQLDEAEEIYRQTNAILRRLLGDEHPELATSLQNLALILAEQGKLDEAEQLHRQALDIQRRLFGNEHPDLARTLNNLASVLRSQEKFQEAEERQREALELNRRLLGEEHLQVASSLYNLGLVVGSQERLDEAEEHFRAALVIERKKSVVHQKSTLGILLQLITADGRPLDRARLLTEHDRSAEALPLLERLLEDETIEDSERLEAQIWTGSALSGMGQFDDAELLLTDLFFGWEDLGIDAPTLKRTLVEQLIRLYDAWDKPDDAAEWQEELQNLADDGN